MAHTLLRIYRKTTNEEIVMKKIKNSIRVCLNAVLTTLIGMFITSCEEGPKGGGVVEMYGVPMAEYDVQGEVMNETNEPLKSMQVVVKANDEYTWPDTVYTNEEGKYQCKYGITSFGEECLQVIVNDTTGEYESDTLHIAPNQMQKVEKGSWNVKYNVDADFQLKKK